MASSAPASNNLLESLPARPPTPPRETRQAAAAASLKKVLRRDPQDPQLSIQTPPKVNRCLAGASGSNPSSSRARKRVEWSAHTDYKEPPDYREASRLNKSSPLSAPTSAISKPVKSILKPSSSPNPLASSLHSQIDGSSGQPNITEMLDSTIKALAGSDRDSRLDAYMMLARALKASNNLPDRVALQDKMSLFMQFIQRDVVSKTDQGSSDSSLVNHALNLLVTFLHFPAIASTLNSDFGIFVMDHCIRCFEDAAVPKDLARHLMQVVAFQTFSAKVMTSERVGRLVSSLHRLERNVTGKSIVMGRIQVYKRLVKQSRNHMSAHTEWLEDMFTDMLSTVRDIRTQAISLGTDAGFALRNETSITRRAADILQSKDEEGITYIEWYIQSLEDILKAKQNPSAVPQIWSVVTLFLRCPLDRWQYFNQWLKLAQSAFNTADMQTKLEANHAWNRYAYLSLTDSRMSPKGFGRLPQPLISQLRRRFNSKQVEEGKKLQRTALGGACNLLYYALRPNHDNLPIDSVWELGVQPVMAQLLDLDGKPEAYGDSLMLASRLMAGLLDVKTPRSWKDDRIKDVTLIAPEELPAIDPKWIRRNVDKIFQAVTPILEKRFTDLAKKDSLTFRLWQTFAGSIAAASAKDIKVSEETARFLAYSFGVLCKVWSQGPPATDGPLGSGFFASVVNFIHILVKTLGLLPFTEKKLSMSVSNTFEPLTTPSLRHDRADNYFGVVRTPLHHLFSILSSIPPGIADDDDYSHFIQAVFEPFFGEKSIKIRVDFAKEMLRQLPRNTICPYGPWILTATNIASLLEQTQSSTSPNTSGGDKLLGPEYREVVSLLERGLTSHPNLPANHWFSLFDRLSTHVVRECGDAGRALGVIEPVSKIVLDNCFSGSGDANKLATDIATALFKVAKLARDRQAIDAARRRLWGAPPTGSKALSIDPYDNLYKLGNQTLKERYDSICQGGDQASVPSLFEAIIKFIEEAVPLAGIKVLVKLSEGLDPWIRDENALLKLGDGSVLSASLHSIWSIICGQLASVSASDKSAFSHIEPFLTAGLKSKHRQVVNKTAEAWNTIVKDEESLECSESLKSVITSLRPQVDLALPGTENPSGHFGAQAQSFVDSQDEMSFIALSSSKSSRQNGAVAPSPTLPRMRIQGPMTRKRRRDATPEVVQAKPSKRTSTPRLRHDNSQIQFAPIASSPLASSPLAEESQHLTERQKEVRQRQQDNAGIYPSMRSTPRTRSRSALAEKSNKSDAVNGTPHQATPERPASYEEFISLTPTPRRGQALQIEGFNDPPSSPPEPRRNPLLSEIQTRSKARNSLDSWEFSSPPGSPSVGKQQELTDPKPTQPTPANGSSRSKGKRKPRAKASSQDIQVIPSSFLIENDAADDSSASASKRTLRGTRSKAKAAAAEPPSTPPPEERSTIVETQETPKSGDDEFVDARSSPAQAASTKDMVADLTVQPSQKKDPSFAFSEGDESSLMRFVVELEARQCNLPFDKVDLVSPEKCIMVQGESPASSVSSLSPPPEDFELRVNEIQMDEAAEVNETAEVDEMADMEVNDGVRKIKTEEEEDAHIAKEENTRVPSPAADLAPTEAAPDSTKRQSKRKRKRSAKLAEAGRKRRRSVDSRASSQAVESQTADATITSPTPIARRSLRHSRSSNLEDGGSKGSRLEASDREKTKTKKVATLGNGTEVGESVDTDEELMSQLVTESNAASQSQPESEEGGKAPLPASNDSLEPNDQTTRKPIENPNQGSTGRILQALRGGLDEIRGAALSREEVYQLEDMLLDMRRELVEAERRGRK